MTPSELKYLTVLNDLYEEGNTVKMTDMAERMDLSKVSVYRAVEKLIGYGYASRQGKRIYPTENGKNILQEYLVCISFIEAAIVNNSSIPRETAHLDAINTVCIVSNAGRSAILKHLKGRANEKAEGNRSGDAYDRVILQR